MSKEEKGVGRRAKKQPYRRIALAFSLFFLLVWGLMGTGASLAWFTDTSTEINNIFHFAEFDLEVSHRLPDGTWEPVTGQTKIFDENALYEPGYTQVVYLQVKNKGTVPFRFHTAVNVNGCIIATNVFGQHFSLQDYLLFGVAHADTEAGMDAKVADRKTAQQLADMKLHAYHTDSAVLDAGDTVYIALVVWMPEEVDNVANYRGDIVPSVDLGITVKADQIQE